MAQNIMLMGASYTAVPAVTLPKTGGGTASFTDVTDTTASAADVAAGKYFYTAAGVRTQGTNSGGGGDTPQPEKLINFIDYDGTILHSYTAAEWESVAALPSNPSHTGLVAQGWNWTKAQIDTQLTAAPNGKVWVGQMYTTASGDTEIDVRLCARLNPILTIAVNGTITIDWGDGTTPESVTGNSLTTRLAPRHIYTTGGEYTIKIHKVSGAYVFYGASSHLLLRKNTNTNDSRCYSNSITAIRIGTGLKSIGAYAFYYCTSLEYVTIPNTITSIGTYAFGHCYSMNAATIPSSVTSLQDSTFGYCYSMGYVSLPGGLTGIGTQTFAYCHTVKSVTIPYGVNNIGDQVFRYSYGVSYMVIPNGVTTIGAVSLSNMTSMTLLVVPSSVTTIRTSFQSNKGMAEYHFKSSTPPSLEASAFSGITSDCKIYVPASSLTAYQTATNWSTYASYMVGE